MSGKFKLITGLGNKDINRVKDLVLIWAKAGADIFDTSPAVVEEVQRAFISNGLDLDDYDFCVSTAIEGDIHGKKAKINPEICTKCGKCTGKCPENAINPPFVSELKCIGCMKCKKSCKYGAIEFYDDDSGFFEIINKNVKIDTVEVHISIKDKELIKSEFKKIIRALDFSNSAKNAKISVCFSRKYFSNSKTEKILLKLKKLSGKRDFAVQADGNSMNGGKDELQGTVEAVAFGLFVKSLGYEVILSGGCNAHTAHLAHEAGLLCSIGYGSFARKLTAGLDFETALNRAKEFVYKTKELIK